MRIWLNIRSYSGDVDKLVRFDAVKVITSNAAYTRVEYADGKITYYDHEVYLIKVENIANY